MPKGIWVWPSNPRDQRRVLRKVASSPHLTAALTALAKSKDGMSNAELDDAIGSNSEWTTLWVIRQLTALGFVELKVDFFGNAARYRLSDIGRAALSVITGAPAQRPVATVQPTPQAVAPKTN